MGSSHLGELGFGNGRSGSSKKGKRSNPEKPKKPQRGLGVAQLEKIRLQNQMPGYLPSFQYSPYYSFLNMDDEVGLELPFSSSSFSSFNTASSSPLFALHPNIMMGFGESQRTDVRYGEFRSSPIARSLMMNHGSGIFRAHRFEEQKVTLPLFQQSMEVVLRILLADECFSSISILDHFPYVTETHEGDLLNFIGFGGEEETVAFGRFDQSEL